MIFRYKPVCCLQVVAKPPAAMTKGVRKRVSVTQLDDGIEGSAVTVETVHLSPDDVKLRTMRDKLFRVIRDGDFQLVRV